jgi:hypothetical protein
MLPLSTIYRTWAAQDSANTDRTIDFLCKVSQRRMNLLLHLMTSQAATCRVFKNHLKYDLKSNQIICPKYDLKSQSNCHFPKRFKIEIKSNRFTQLPIILVFLACLSTCIIILKMLTTFSKNKIYVYVILLVFVMFINCFVDI